MTVEELIELLKGVRQDAPVYFRVPSCNRSAAPVDLEEYVPGQEPLELEATGTVDVSGGQVTVICVELS